MTTRQHCVRVVLLATTLVWAVVCAAQVAGAPPTANPKTGAGLTARQVIAAVEAATEVAAPANTVDTIKAGDPDTVVTGVVVTFMDTYAVLEKAVALGANLVITHEPTFYNHPDDLMALPGDAVTAQKLQYIRAHGLVVWRFHDTWHVATGHLLKPDGILTGEVQALGWEKFQDAGDAHVFHLPETTVGALAEDVERKLGSHAVQVVGDRAMKVRTAGLLPGASGLQKQTRLLGRDGVDVLVAGESAQWEGVAWALDATAEGRAKALILVGHEASEEAGMKYCAEWLRPILPGIKITWVAAGEPWAR